MTRVRARLVRHQSLPRPPEKRDKVFDSLQLAGSRLLRRRTQGASGSTTLRPEPPLPPSAYVHAAGHKLGVAGALVDDANTAVEFTSTGGHVFVGDVFDFTGVASLSLEAWIQPTRHEPYARVISKENATSGYAMELLPNGNVGCFREAGGGEELVMALLPPGAFSHVVVTFDGARSPEPTCQPASPRTGRKRTFSMPGRP